MTVISLLAEIASHAPLLAQSASAGQQGPQSILGNPIVLMVLMFVMMYFVLIRPQRQKQKDAEKTQSSLQAGDEVVTIGGAHGVVTTVNEKTVVVRMVEGKIEFDRSAIAVRRAKS